MWGILFGLHVTLEFNSKFEGGEADYSTIFPLHNVQQASCFVASCDYGGSKARCALHRQSIPFLYPWISVSLEAELTFFSCSQAMHTCLVRKSKIFKTHNTEKLCQAPWCLHIPCETIALRSSWPFSSPLTHYLPQHSRSSRYTTPSLKFIEDC